MESIRNVCDYIIERADAGGERLSILKLQKLLYYSQAWHLAITKERLFDGQFKAWVHGPVNTEIYHQFKDGRNLYSCVGKEVLQVKFTPELLSDDARNHIDRVLEVYMPYSGTQLEEMTHKEDPWIEARGGLADHERCTTEINEQTMTSYYGSRLS